jgi:hypothetical protein
MAGTGLVPGETRVAGHQQAHRFRLVVCCRRILRTITRTFADLA